MLRTTTSILLLATLTGCANKSSDYLFDNMNLLTSPQYQSTFYLPDNLISEHLHDIAGLYRHWLSTISPSHLESYDLSEERTIRIRKDSETYRNDITALVDGYERYCIAAGGNTKELEHSSLNYLLECNKAGTNLHYLRFSDYGQVIKLGYWTPELKQLNSNINDYFELNNTDSITGTVFMQDGTSFEFTDIEPTPASYYNSDDLHSLHVTLSTELNPFAYNVYVPLKDLYLIAPIITKSDQASDSYRKGFFVILNSGETGLAAKVRSRKGNVTIIGNSRVEFSNGDNEGASLEFEALRGIKQLILNNGKLATSNAVQAEMGFLSVERRTRFTEDSIYAKNREHKAAIEQSRRKAEQARALKNKQEQDRIIELLNINNIGRTVCITGKVTNSQTNESVYGILGATIDEVNINSSALKVISTGKWESSQALWTPNGSINTLYGINVEQPGIAVWVEPEKWELCELTN